MKCEYGNCIAKNICPTKGCVIAAKFVSIDAVLDPMVQRMGERLAEGTEADLADFNHLHGHLRHRYNPDECPSSCKPEQAIDTEATDG